MREIEQRAIRALHDVKMPERSWHRERAEDLNRFLTGRVSAALFPSEAGDLWFLVWRYRRQITDMEIVAKANEIVNGALHLEFPA